VEKLTSEVNARISQYQDGAITLKELILVIVNLYLTYRDLLDSEEF
jgi:hypothetical protein